MYNISVPIMSACFKRAGREKMVSYLKEANIKRVFLALDTYTTNKEKLNDELSMLRDNCRYLKNNGFEVGAWTWTFWLSDKCEYARMTSFDGTEHSDFCCPADPDFRKAIGEYLCEIAKCGVDLILFDDDYRYVLGNTFNCVCKYHMAEICKILGEELTSDELYKKAFEPNGDKKYRTAWIDANGKAFADFAKNAREYVDKINPNIRIGVCSCFSSWGNDGITPMELCRLLAGNTKPFLRLIGAPYWVSAKNMFDCRLQNVVEFERMQAYMANTDTDIEILCEGDTYPRPRYSCPATYLELFDTALRADGGTNGILKYMFDYTSTSDYETEYFDRHLRNTALYSQIDKAFENKKPCGIRVYEDINKLRYAEIPENVTPFKYVENSMFNPASKMLSDLSFPTVYSGEGICGIAFGENINVVPDGAFKKGMILDLKAAMILMDKGIDVGISQVGEKISPYEEHFVGDAQEYTGAYYKANKVTLNKKAEVLSYCVYKDQNGVRSESPAAFFYQNDRADKFIIFAFDGYFNHSSSYRTYTRAKQLTGAIEKFSENILPCSCLGNPDLYVLCKKDNSSMSVGLWNMFADSIHQPIIKLNKKYKEITFINCNGRLDGDKVYLSEMSAFTFAGFEVK